MSACSRRLAAGAAAEMRQLKQPPGSYSVLLFSRIGMNQRRASIIHRSSSLSCSLTFEAAVPAASAAAETRWSVRSTRKVIQRRKERMSRSSASSYAVFSNEVKHDDDDDDDDDDYDDVAVVSADGNDDVAMGVEGKGEKERRRAEVVVAAAATVALGVGNRVLYKLALVPLKRYPFFLAQLATFGYVLVYFSILYIRYHAGKVTDEMLSLPKTPFVAVGLLEALGAVSGMAAGAMLSGAAIPVLSQSFLVWQLVLSFIFLGRRYSLNQLLGCFLVAVGVITTVASGSSAGSLIEAGAFWSFLMIISFLFQAADTVLKEIIFAKAAQKLKGGSVDLFVVNSYGSAFQAAFICLLLPFLSKLWGIPFYQLPNYIKDGAACFLNIGTISHECNGAPLLPLLFVVVNMGFNISLLHLLKISSAVVSCLVSTFSVPISVFLFTLPLPYIGVASSLPSGFVAGACILVVGMLIYTWRPSLIPTYDPMPATATPLFATD